MYGALAAILVLANLASFKPGAAAKSDIKGLVSGAATGTATLTAFAAWKPTAAITLTRISGRVVTAGTCTACGLTNHTFRVTDGTTNSDCTNGTAITCTTAANTTFSCTPSNTNRALDEELQLQMVPTGGNCTTQPVFAVTAEYQMQ